MPTFLEEAALLDPVRGNLRRRGYRRQRSEVQFFEYSIDLYGYAMTRNATVAVELKLCRWKRAFEQALIYQLCADFVYLALPSSSASRVTLPLLSRHGIGLIGVQPNSRCLVLLEATRSTVLLPAYRSFYVQLMKGDRG